MTAYMFEITASEIDRINIERELERKIQIKTKLQRRLPMGLKSSDVYVNDIQIRFNDNSQEKISGHDRRWAKKISKELKGKHFGSSKGFAKDANRARLGLDIEITAISAGNTAISASNQKDDIGFAQLRIAFTITDLTRVSCPVLKTGNIDYVDPLKEYSLIRKQFGRDAGKGALMAVLPLFAKELISRQMSIVIIP